MGTIEDAGKTASEIIEKVIDFTEEIAVKTVDVFDVIEESAIDFAQSAQEFASETGDFVRKKVEEASVAMGIKPMGADAAAQQKENKEKKQ